jgi:hypothetical protein
MADYEDIKNLDDLIGTICVFNTDGFDAKEWDDHNTIKVKIIGFNIVVNYGFAGKLEVKILIVPVNKIKCNLDKDELYDLKTTGTYLELICFDVWDSKE